jgi:hypothetical protein
MANGLPCLASIHKRIVLGWAAVALPPQSECGSTVLELQLLRLDAARDSYLYVPVGYRTERSAPLVLLLHGAGGHARLVVEYLRYLPPTRPGSSYSPRPLTNTRGTYSSAAATAPMRP